MPDEYLQRLPESLRKPGNAALGEIELLAPDTTSRYGILYEDKYILLVRDRVRFPDGREGSYLRVLHTSELTGGCGTVMVPIWNDQIVLIRIYRHATRDWEWELPRGFQEPGISEQENAEKETMEELGVEPARVWRIGAFNANTGLLTGMIGVYAVELAADPRTSGRPEANEGIGHFRTVAERELADLVARGEIRCGISLAALYLYGNSKR